MSNAHAPAPVFVADTQLERIALGIRQRTLPKPEWTHAAHFAAAFCFLRDPAMNALRDMPALIRAYNESTGVPNTDTDGYHETITFASLRAAQAWLSARPDEPLHQALNELLAGEFGRSAWLLKYWSRPVLFSVNARRRWVEPDLQPLPF